MAERIQGMSIGLGLDTVQIERGLTGLKDRLRTVNSEMKANLSAFDYAEESVEKYEVKLRGLSNKLEVQKRIVSQSRAEYEKMVQKYGEGSRQAERAATAFNNQVASLNNLQRAYNRTSQSMIALEQEQRSLQSVWGKLGRLFDDTGEKLTNVGSISKDVGSSLSASLTLPIIGAGVGITGLAKQFDDSSVRIKNSLDLTAEETKKLTAISKSIYEDGFGESLEEVDNALLETKQNIRSINDEDLEDITKKAMTLANTFEADVNEVTRAGNSLIENYGMNAQEAFDLMAKGAKNGMNFSKEMFDNMAEYTISFKEAGFSAEEMFSILSNGAQKGYNLDRLNDTMLEFKLQSEDSSEAYITAMGQMSKGTQKVFKDYQNGKATVSDLYKAVIPELEKLRKTMPEKEFNVIGKSLFGTKWEDQGADVVLSMKTVNKELENSKGTMNDMTKNVEQSFGARLKGTLREAGDALLPFGNILMNVAEDIMPKVSTGIEKVANFINRLSPAGQTAVVMFAGLLAALGPVLTVVGMFVGAISNIFPIFSKVAGVISRAGGLLNILKIAFTALTGPIGVTISIITLLATAFINLYNKSETFRNFINKLWESIKTGATLVLNFLKTNWQLILAVITGPIGLAVYAITKHWDSIKTATINAFNAVISFFKQWGPLMLAALTGPIGLAIYAVVKHWDSIKATTVNTFNSVKNFLSDVWLKIRIMFNLYLALLINNFNTFKTGIVNAAIAIRDRVVNFFSDLWTKAKAIFNLNVALLINLFNTFKTGLTNIVSNIKTAIINHFTNLWNNIKSIFNSIRQFLTNTWNSIKTFLVNIALSIVNTLRQRWDNLKNNTTSIFNSIKTFLSNLWEGIRKTVTNLANRIKDGIVNAWNTVKSRTTDIFNSIKSKVTGIFDDVVSAAKNLPGRIGSGIKKMAGGVTEGVKAVGKKLASGLETALNAITQKGINVVLGKIGVDKKNQIPKLDIPGYKTGTDSHPGGFFFAGDGGQNELIRFPDGRMIMSPDTTTLYWGDKGTQVLSGKQTEQVMGAFPMYAKGTGIKDALSTAGDWIYNSGKKVVNKGKDIAVATKDAVSNAIGDVWAYASNPKKLMDKVFGMLNIQLPDVSGVMLQIAKSGITKVKDGSVDFIKKQFDKLTEFGGSIGGAGKNAQSWRPAILAAASRMGETLSEREIKGIIAQIHRESGGNEKITQSPLVRDINVLRGNPARGLLQYIPQSFMRYAMPGHTNIYSGYDQLLAFFNNTSWRKNLPYGKRGWGPTGKRKYKDGTDFHIGGDAILGDGFEYEPFLLPNGLFGLSPNTPTLFSNLPAGTKVWANIQDFIKQYAGVFSSAQQNNRTDAMKLLALAARKLDSNPSRSSSNSISNSSHATTVQQQEQQPVIIQNTFQVTYSGLPNREDVMKFMDLMEEISEEKKEQELRRIGLRS